MFVFATEFAVVPTATKGVSFALFFLLIAIFILSCSESEIGFGQGAVSCLPVDSIPINREIRHMP